MTMVTVHRILIACTLSPFLLLPACEKQAEQGPIELTQEDLRDAKAAVEELHDLAETDAGEYRRMLEERLEIFDQKLDELAEKAGKKPVAELRAMSSRVHARLDEARDAAGEAWEQAKQDIEAALDKLVAAYERVEARCG